MRQWLDKLSPMTCIFIFLWLFAITIFAILGVITHWSLAVASMLTAVACLILSAGLKHLEDQIRILQREEEDDAD